MKRLNHKLKHFMAFLSSWKLQTIVFFLNEKPEQTLRACSNSDLNIFSSNIYSSLYIYFFFIFFSFPFTLKCSNEFNESLNPRSSKPSSGGIRNRHLTQPVCIACFHPFFERHIMSKPCPSVDLNSHIQHSETSQIAAKFLLNLQFFPAFW